ncbi:hypothetical protein, partial [Nitrosomonas nitrosa]|uniref:hypothetical protein n=1 Tax=Nitrosomonas nitrosa TaxID=52442 RepID=UPI0019578B73
MRRAFVLFLLGCFFYLALREFVYPVAALLIDELGCLEVERWGFAREGEHVCYEGVGAVFVCQKEGAYVLVGKRLQGVGVVAVFVHFNFHVVDQAVYVACHEVVLVGNAESVRVHEAQFVEVADMNDQVGCLFCANEFPQFGYARFGGKYEGFRET